jgi:hypothetical protein
MEESASQSVILILRVLLFAGTFLLFCYLGLKGRLSMDEQAKYEMLEEGKNGQQRRSKR